MEASRTPEFPPTPQGSSPSHPLRPPSPPPFLFPALALSTPHGGSASPSSWPLRRCLSRRCSRRPLHPPVTLSPRSLVFPIATPSSGSGPLCPPLSPHPMLCCSPHSPCSTSRFRPPLLPTYLGALRPLTLPNALLPPAPAANIARRDKYVGNRMGRIFVLWSLASGFVPRIKFPSRPRAAVRDGISRSLFHHLPQQWHPVHCLPALRHSHACTDGPVVDQVECRVQLHHHWTISRDRWLGRLAVELVINPP